MCALYALTVDSGHQNTNLVLSCLVICLSVVLSCLVICLTVVLSYFAPHLFICVLLPPFESAKKTEGGLDTYDAQVRFHFSFFHQ